MTVPFENVEEDLRNMGIKRRRIKALDIVGRQL
jgi:hypothetical protein